MLQVYMGRPLGKKDFIESFGPARADHFEKLLGEFCDEEGLPYHWRRKKHWRGFYTFTGKEIAQAINSCFEAYKGGCYTQPPGPYGSLSPAVFRSATQADLLRFVLGCKSRYCSTNRALFNAANGGDTFMMLADALKRLGCTNIRLYLSKDLVPTTTLLIFTPSKKVQDRTGIRHEVTYFELKRSWPDTKLVRFPLPP
ncbi:MAG: hypothetical protein ACYC67_18300 [Prosthecobacter sp.]